MDHKAPALLASFLFVVNIVLAAFLLKGNFEENAATESESSAGGDDKNEANERDNKKSSKEKSFWENIKACYSSKSLASVIASLLIFSWMFRATSYASMGSYYEDMYGVEPHTRGYIQSYQRVWYFVVQSLLIQPVLERTGGERRAVFLAAILLAGSTFFESQRSFRGFLFAICPAIALSVTMMRVSLRSLLTQLAPKDAIFSVFAAMDVLQNASAVTVPFYRAFLFRILSSTDADNSSNQTGMDGDPDPVAWVLCAGLHWAVAAVLLVYLLRPEQQRSKPVDSIKKDL